MFGLRRYFDPKIRAARCRAIEYVRAHNPNLLVTNARLRAEEPSRYVFAVFYRDPDLRVVPGRYKLIAMARDGDGIEELNSSPDSPYWIRGLK